MIDTTGQGRYYTLSLPVGRIAPEATRAHGWTPRTLREAGARHWPEVHDEFVDTLRSAKVVLGWNVDFDQRMLFQTVGRHQQQLPRPRWHDVMRDYASDGVDAPPSHGVTMRQRDTHVVCGQGIKERPWTTLASSASTFRREASRCMGPRRMSADRPIRVMSLLLNPDGQLINMSIVPVRSGAPPAE